jgi:hypothetical protein
VHSDVISFIALDLILRTIFCTVMYVTFELNVMRVLLDDNAFDESGFRIPPDMVPNGKFFHHSQFLSRHWPHQAAAWKDRAGAVPDSVPNAMSGLATATSDWPRR